MWRWIVASLLFAPLLAGAGEADNAPRVKRVALQEFTTLTIDIVPDLGTRLVFPFVLDEQPRQGEAPFTMTLTNGVFKSDRKEGRNVLVLTAPPSRDGGDMSGYLGDLFISVAGYNITARLRTVKDWREHYTDIVFEPSEEDRQDLIDAAVQRRLQALESEYQRKLEALEQDIDQRALAKVAYLALQDAEEDRVKEYSRMVLANGDRLVLSVDSVLGYDQFSIVPFELEADTLGDVKILDARLFVQADSDSPAHLLPTSLQVRRRVEAGERVQGVVAAEQSKLMAYEVIKLVVLTDQGQVELTW
ncbi:hypothetical protein Tel_17065 (plasmid) [Candidatus Tenderia electrophaga]|jgi:hypothetical protein|uniref:DUF2381 family protein n=1 Tax=Candidatus Tenderia electrophaga TaxID=1748243 RepID=A0A0S2TIH7_9GAMM|nr:hypothetical protein Tel_17065 [Candidatus Tenderia electrophaga]